mmetsp:Transcript_28309/g.83659  ORF Transcript_28309/g.83659 Transcript_28309/m.83659 type:complete len:375 (-) Transcript_28309:65-1189(-)
MRVAPAAVLRQRSRRSGQRQVPHHPLVRQGLPARPRQPARRGGRARRPRLRAGGSAAGVRGRCVQHRRRGRRGVCLAGHRRRGDRAATRLGAPPPRTDRRAVSGGWLANPLLRRAACGVPGAARAAAGDGCGRAARAARARAARARRQRGARGERPRRRAGGGRGADGPAGRAAQGGGGGGGRRRGRGAGGGGGERRGVVRLADGPGGRAARRRLWRAVVRPVRRRQAALRRALAQAGVRWRHVCAARRGDDAAADGGPPGDEQRGRASRDGGSIPQRAPRGVPVHKERWAHTVSAGIHPAPRAVASRWTRSQPSSSSATRRRRTFPWWAETSTASSSGSGRSSPRRATRHENGGEVFDLSFRKEKAGLGLLAV